MSAPHLIRHYPLDLGSLEIEYMEQYFAEFTRPKSSGELRARLESREHLILISLAPAPDDASHWMPVAFKVAHELRAPEREPDPLIRDLALRLAPCLDFRRRRVFYSWLGGTRREWRQQGHYRALTEQQEEWALRHGYQDFVVKTKNRYYGMRAALDHLHFDVIKFEPDATDTANAKVYVHKRLSPETMQAHLTSRLVSHA